MLEEIQNFEVEGVWGSHFLKSPQYWNSFSNRAAFPSDKAIVFRSPTISSVAMIRRWFLEHPRSVGESRTGSTARSAPSFSLPLLAAGLAGR